MFDTNPHVLSASVGLISYTEIIIILRLAKCLRRSCLFIDLGACCSGSNSIDYRSSPGPTRNLYFRISLLLLRLYYLDMTNEKKIPALQLLYNVILLTDSFPRQSLVSIDIQGIRLKNHTFVVFKHF